MVKGNDSHQDSHQDTNKDVGAYRRMELITGTVRRRAWSAEERARIVAESFEPGANVAAVARRYHVNGGLLHCWRRKAKALAREPRAADMLPPFVPVAIGETALRAVSQSPRMIEIETGGALVRVPSGVDPETLSLVLATLRRGP